MIPVSDVIPTRTFPGTTVALILVNVATLAITGGSIPVVANIICLWLFASTIEDRFGHVRLALLSIVCAAAAVVVARAGPALPIAAGGAVAGSIGAYFTLYPTSRILMLLPIPLSVYEAPAVPFPFAWVVVQFLSLAASSPRAFAATGPRTLGAYFVASLIGMALANVLSKPERARVEWWSP
jgi:rhomboid family protein